MKKEKVKVKDFIEYFTELMKIYGDCDVISVTTNISFVTDEGEALSQPDGIFKIEFGESFNPDVIK